MKSIKYLKSIYGKELETIFKYWHEFVNPELTEMDILETLLNMKIEAEASYCKEVLEEQNEN